MSNFSLFWGKTKKKLVRYLELIYFLPLQYRMKRLITKTKMPNLLRSNLYSNKSLSSQIKDINLSYLITSGWFESKLNNSSYFAGEYHPWITFSAINFLNRLTLKNLSVLEFGSGASTIYFSSRSKKVVSFEFDSDYYPIIKAATREYTNLEIYEFGFLSHLNSKNFELSPEFEISEALDTCMITDLNLFGLNAKYIFEKDHYIKIKNSIQEADLIFIDGGPRNTELLLSAIHARHNTIILVDNTDSDYLKNGIWMLRLYGFKEIPFAGLGPLNPYESQTSIFIKNLDSFSDIYNDPSELRP
jgi:hypothetical protein